jgi:hypothetical protein
MPNDQAPLWESHATADAPSRIRTCGLLLRRECQRKRRLTTIDDARRVSPLVMRDCGRSNRMGKRSRFRASGQRSGDVMAMAHRLVAADVTDRIDLLELRGDDGDG